MKEQTQTTIAYGLYLIFTLSVLAWALLREYQYGGNPEEVKPCVDTIVVYKPTNFASHKDWEDFTKAIIWVESKGDSNAKGSKNDVGVLQITPILVEDCNRIVGYEKYDLADRLDSLKSVEMFNVIQGYYNPQRDYHWALKLWNARSAPSYHRAVMDKFNEIKNKKQ